MLCFGKRSTFNVNIPMIKEHVFSVPPYEIFKVSLLVEMTTSAKTYTHDGRKMVSEVRPDLHVNIEDERDLVLVRSRKELNATMSYVDDIDDSSTSFFFG